MPKRKSVAHKIDDNDEYNANYISNDSEFVPSPQTSRRASKKSNASHAKRPKLALGDESSSTSLAISGSRKHLTTRHIIDNDRGAMQGALLQWYEGVCEIRGMPWRKSYNAAATPEERAQRAYEVWVSEIMLQQTQVATVIPYWNNWMKSFPTIKYLADSDIDTVNALWKGLGYYSRAARLLVGAKKVINELDGKLPDNAKEMESVMPGIGRYTAGAICSIAYNEQVPVLDGNVMRLLSRVLALHAPPKAKATLDLLWAGATSLVKDCACAGNLNQSLIELGSTVCKSRDPSCGGCPIKQWCHAYQLSRGKHPDDIPDIEDACTVCETLPQTGLLGGPPVTSYPMATERKKQREELDMVYVIEWIGKEDRWFLLVRRPEAGLLAGLHEFPTEPNISPDDAKTGSESFLRPLFNRLFVNAPQLKESTKAEDVRTRVTGIREAGDILHIFSHIRKTYRVSWVTLEGGEGDNPPVLRSSDEVNLTTSKTKVKTTAKSKRSQPSAVIKPSESAPPVMLWLRLAEVEHANIGTGVMKIWKLTQSLWGKAK